MESSNRKLEKSLAQKLELISNLVSVKNASFQRKNLQEENLQLKNEIAATNQEIEDKDIELLALKHKIFTLSIEITRKKEKLPQMPIFRAKSDINGLFLFKDITLPNIKDIKPPILVSTQAFSKDLPPLKKTYNSENSKLHQSKILMTKNVKIREMKIHEKRIISMNQSNHEPLLLTFSNDRTFKCLDLKQKTLIKLPHRENQWDHMYLNGDFSPDSRQIACCTTENNIEIFSLYPGKFKTILKGHKASVCDAKYLNKNTIVSCSEDISIKLWDINKGLDFLSYCNGSKGKSLGICGKDENCFYCGHYDGNLRVFDKKIGKAVKEIKLFKNNGIKSMKVSHSGNYLIVLGNDACEMKFLDLREMKFIEVDAKELEDNKNINSVALWSNESFVIGGGDKGELIVVDSFAKNNWYVFEGTKAKQSVSCCAYIVNTKNVYTGDIEGNVIEWELKEEHIYG